MTGRHFSSEEKLQTVLEWNKGTPISHICKTHQVTPKAVRDWKRKYEKHGIEGLKKRKKHRTYTRMFKEMVAKEYLDETISLPELAYKYDIPSNETVRKWIIRYNNGEEIRTMREGASTLTKGRKITYAEKENQKIS